METVCAVPFPYEDVIEGELDDVVGGRDEAPQAVEKRHAGLAKMNN